MHMQIFFCFITFTSIYLLNTGLTDIGFGSVHHFQDTGTIRRKQLLETSSQVISTEDIFFNMEDSQSVSTLQPTKAGYSGKTNTFKEISYFYKWKKIHTLYFQHNINCFNHVINYFLKQRSKQIIQTYRRTRKVKFF